MRINPGSPESPRQQQPAGPAHLASPSFRTLLARRITEATGSWRRLIGADPQWSAAPVLTAPQRPPGMESETPERSRLALRDIASASGGPPSAERLRAALAQKLDSEERVLVRASTGRK